MVYLENFLIPSDTLSDLSGSVVINAWLFFD